MSLYNWHWLTWFTLSQPARLGENMVVIGNSIRLPEQEWHYVIILLASIELVYLIAACTSWFYCFGMMSAAIDGAIFVEVNLK